MKFHIKDAADLQRLLNSADLVYDLTRGSLDRFRKELDTLLAARKGRSCLHSALCDLTNFARQLRDAPCKVEADSP